jgi:hypothetical protein
MGDLWVEKVQKWLNKEYRERMDMWLSVKMVL